MIFEDLIVKHKIANPVLIFYKTNQPMIKFKINKKL